MTEFYKGVFRPVLDKWRERKQVSTYVREFRKKADFDDIEIKFRNVLLNTFENYQDGSKFFKEPAHDLDKLTLKANTRKLLIYENTFRLLQKEFNIDKNIS